MTPDQRPPNPGDEVASVPRRFGPGTLLVITAVFAALFAFFRVAHTSIPIIVMTCAFLVTIGLAQAIAGPRNARMASVVTGTLLLPVLGIGASNVFQWRVELDIVAWSLFGFVLGYVTGVLVAGIFLLMRYADQFASQLMHRASEEDEEETGDGD